MIYGLKEIGAMAEQETALDRVKAAVKGKPRGRRGKCLVTLDPTDVVEVCGLIPEKTQKVQDLLLGSSNVLPELEKNPELKVHCQADCIYHLVEQADAAKPQVVKAKAADKADKAGS
jgi:hypothetical protein